MWAVRQSLAPEIKNELHDFLEASLAAGLASLSEIARQQTEPGWSVPEMEAYLRRFHYRLGPEDLEGMARFRQLTNTHLRGHALSAIEYKQRFGYNRGRPLMCRALSRLYAERAVLSGLASHIRSRPIVADPELRRRGGMRPVTLEELLTRRDARRTAGRGAP